MTKKKVQITTNTVQIKPLKSVTTLQNKNNNKNMKRNKKKQNKEKISTNGIPAHTTASSNVFMPSKFGLPDCNVTPNALDWLKAYISPCTETGLTPYSMIIPDAAMPFSASPFQRVDLTIRFPFQSRELTDLTGRNYSMLVLQVPNFRNGLIILGNKLGSEFTPEVVNDLINILNNADPAMLTYPNFLSGDMISNGTPDNYVTSIQSTALQSVPLPDENGISPVISQLRLVFNGLTIGHNTPSLFDQATCNGMVIAMRDTPTSELDNDSAEIIYLRVYMGFNSSIGLTQRGFQILVTAFPEDALQGTNFIPAPTGVANSPTFTSTRIISTIEGNIVVNVGDTYRYEQNDAGEIVLRNQTDTGLFTVLASFITDFSSVKTVRLKHTLLTTDNISGAFNPNFDLIVLPPIQQADIAQIVPGSTIFLMKDGGGCYEPTFKFEPVFSPSGVNFRRQRFAILGSSDSDILAPVGGITDHLDLNFGLGVINIQSMPYAAQPLIKLRRAHQIVPSSGSSFGMFAYNNNVHDQVAIDIADKMHETQVHLHPATANFLDTLVRTVGSVINKLPKVLNSTANIAAAVERVCNTVGGGVTRRNFDNVITRGRF